MAYQSINPNDGKTLKKFAEISSEQLEHSLATAESCFQAWKHISYQERAVIVRKAAGREWRSIRRCTDDSGYHIDDERSGH